MKPNESPAPKRLCPKRPPHARALVAVMVFALSIGCNGLSLGPNEGASMVSTVASRRAGLVLDEAPKVLLTPQGDDVVADAEVYIVAPAGSDKAQSIARYLKAWGAHSVFAEQLSEYGVHSMQVRGIVSSTYAWPSMSFDGGSFVSGITPSNVEAAIAEALSAAPDLPVSSQTVFVVVVPDGITVSLSGDSAQDACAAGVLSWHAATRVTTDDASLSVPYVALGACGGQPGLSEGDTTGMALSHSMLGALTNPRGQGYHGVSGEPSAWQALPGTQEVSSLCAAAMGKSAHVLSHVDSIPWAVHRSWSNAKSEAGEPPCAPSQDDDYTVALAQDTVLVPVSLATQGAGVDLPGVPLAAGASTTVPVRVLGSPSPNDPIHLRAEAVGTSDVQVDVTPAALAAGATAQLKVALSPQAKESRYLLRLTTGREGAAFSQYVLVRRTP